MNDLNYHILKLPLPLRLAHVQSFLIQGPKGYALIDTGIGSATGQDELTQALCQHQVRPQEIRELFVTHYHGDHWGQAGWLSEMGTRVIMSRIDDDFLQRWFERTDYEEINLAYYTKQGAPPELAQASLKALKWLRTLSPYFKATDLVDDGDEIMLAGLLFQVILTPGHSPGHACLEHAATGTIFVGDHVLPHITPNISVEPGTLADPLSAYRSSLKRLLHRGYSLALPAHGPIIRNLDERIHEILEHHIEREGLLLAAMSKTPQSCFALSQALFDFKRLDAWESWMAMGETLAHLRALESAGRVFSHQDSDGEKFSRLLGTTS